MSRFLLYLALGCSLPLGSQCRFVNKQDDPQPAKVLPTITQQGSNTIGFLMNDTVWLPQGSFNRNRMGGYYSNGSFRVWGNYVEVGSRREESFGLTVGARRLRPGTYSLFVPLGVVLGGRVSSANFFRPGKHYETDAKHPGTVTITRLDSVQRIVSGIFECTPIDRVSGDSVRITQGRFDLQY